MSRELWIVFEGEEPTTAHLSLEGAKAAAQWSIRNGQAIGPYSIWTAKLDHDPADKGIPILKTSPGGNLDRGILGEG